MSSNRVRRVALPVPGEKNVLITSALPYVNNVPHLGNIIGCVLSADVYARFCRLRGYNSLYICGTDEYGTATETKAMQEGATPQEICDKYHAIHKQVYEWFNIDFDIFGRTSTPLQTEICQDIYHRNDARGLVKEKDVEQLYCANCDRFLADRFVAGICPDCNYADAKGDQCDGCGHLMDAIKLKHSKCTIDGSTPSLRTSRHLFIDLPSLSDELTTWIDKSSVCGAWSSNSTTVTRAWLKEGLQERCITRDLRWGTQVPREGFSDKVFYVWFDAPIGYISITASLTKNWRQWWKNPNEVELIQFMGKDNIPFHTVIFPCTLLGADDGYTMLHHVSTTEYLNYESGKFSKSRGVGVFGDSVQLTGVPPEVWRYYLLSNRPETGDTIFTWDDFAEKNNSELLKNLGNFINRALKFCQSKFQEGVPSVSIMDDADHDFIQNLSRKKAEYIDMLDSVKIKGGLRVLMAASSQCNSYFQHNAPWELIKSSETLARCGTVINIGCNAVVLLATMAQPYMPGLTAKILDQMNLEHSVVSLRSTEFELVLQTGHLFNKPEPLFETITSTQVQLWRSKFGGPERKEFALQLVSGMIESLVPHETAENLYIIQVNVGDVSRQIVSGLVKHYSIDDLVGRSVVVLLNLKPANFRGVRSNGMIMCGTQDNALGIMTTPSAPGTPIAPSGFEVLTARLDAKKNLKKLLPLLKTNVNGEVLFKDTLLLSANSPVVVDRLSGVCDIK